MLIEGLVALGSALEAWRRKSAMICWRSANLLSGVGHICAPRRDRPSGRIIPRSTRATTCSGALIALLILPVGAQQAPQGTPTRIRGTVEKLDGQALTVKSREGQTATIALADNVVIAYLIKKNVGDIKPGDYIASTGIKGTDGKLHAIEVRIFPESLRGAGEGQYPWDLQPDSVMTNATVGTITQVAARQRHQSQLQGD